MVECPLAIDLFCGLGGWTDGLLAEGYDKAQNTKGRQRTSASTSGINRKAASAMIAKIPLPLSRHIAATFRLSADG